MSDEADKQARELVLKWESEQHFLELTPAQSIRLVNYVAAALRAKDEHIAAMEESNIGQFEWRNNAVKEMAEKDAEIAKLNAELTAALEAHDAAVVDAEYYKGKLKAALAQFEDARKMSAELKAAQAAGKNLYQATEILIKERDEARQQAAQWKATAEAEADQVEELRKEAEQAAERQRQKDAAIARAVKINEHTWDMGGWIADAILAQVRP